MIGNVIPEEPSLHELAILQDQLASILSLIRAGDLPALGAALERLEEADWYERRGVPVALIREHLDRGLPLHGYVAQCLERISQAYGLLLTRCRNYQAFAELLGSER
jgi:hypothetical protein